ncbi:MFS transporter [Kribbella sandramycini]|uniref:2-oxoisovalerate dehydrogenase E1 component n=1 Tax=Kribbella sandramycini TaxID=60450 RepID=A0A7Y4P1I0_9ACTN|nr:thiamine pyrophosphate-dependent enzyme [Kribbella sandramycini]MBB6566361.1 2-oxoisovalerate dehydrogenase E1 component [Kribbella sandramycini]NOL42978.1 MFS transporter [Kribbella sandramycini]
MTSVDQRFADRVRALQPAPCDYPAELLRSLYDAQLGSRHADLAARWLQSQGQGFYTIGSAGHEGNAAVAAALRPTDPALLHYRSGAFYLARAEQCGAKDGLRDILLGVAAATSEPIAGGRHKVFGRHDLAIIPQTSTIASHLPRAMGVAFSMNRAAKLGVPSPWPADAIVVTSFGDASANHSTATGAINAALHASYQGLPMPLLLVCEDNGLGISVRTPDGWIKQAYGHRPGLRYFDADGTDLAATLEMTTEAATFVRRNRRPAFLRLRTVRLLGHAGSDVEAAYRSPAEIAAEEELDPLLGTAKRLLGAGLGVDEVIERYEEKRAEAMRIAAEVAGLPQLSSAEIVAAPLRFPEPEVVADALPQLSRATDRLTLSQSINRALADVLAAYPEAMVFGEDVGRKGGVYGVTRGLQKTFGPARVFDTLLDEQSILGLALGAGVSGLLPLPEIQYLAYLHNAEDQLRGEAASLKFFSQEQYKNPMVLRIAGYGYQKGFGGHFHNDDAIAVLRDIPGIVIASPSRPDDAAAMLLTCAAAARASGTVSVFLEPIALYHRRDLYDEADDAWATPYPTAPVPLGRGRTYGGGTELTLVTFGNGVPMSLRVAARVPGVRVLDLRWLAPLPVEDLLREATATGRVLVVDETRRSGGVSEGILAALVDHGFTGRMARVTSYDSYVPLGAAAHHVLLDEATIEKAARELLS